MSKNGRSKRMPLKKNGKNKAVNQNNAKNDETVTKLANYVACGLTPHTISIKLDMEIEAIHELMNSEEMHKLLRKRGKKACRTASNWLEKHSTTLCESDDIAADA